MVWDVKKILNELKKQLPAYVPDEIQRYFPGSYLEAKELKVLNSRPTALELKDGLVTSMQLEDFAKGLNFFSPRGYDYARQNLKLNLRHPKLVREMFIQMNGSPGYMLEMLDIIKIKAAKSDKPPLCSLSMVVQQLDPYGKYNFGCEVDFGGFDCGGEDAKEVLIFLVTFLDETLHIPVGYFLVPHLNCDQLKNMLYGALELTHEAGAKVVSLTTKLNFHLFESLGCKLKSFNLKTTFDHPVTQEPVAIFVDVNECMQYIRLALQNFSPIKVNDSNNIIDFHHMVTSVNFLATATDAAIFRELIEAHVSLRGWRKANIACEKLSNSVAGIIRMKSQELSKENACDVEPTIEYIETFNNVCDILTTTAMTNSSNVNEKQFKSLMKPDDAAAVLQYFNTVVNYMTSLKGVTGQDLLEDRHVGRGFLGLLICMHSAAFLYDRIVSPDNLNMLPLQKFSLEHIKMFINIIKAENHLKPNQEPLCKHYKDYFESLLKRINSKTAEQKLMQLKKEFILKTNSVIDKINMTNTRVTFVECDEVVKVTITKSEHKTLKLIYSAPHQVLDFTNPITTYVAGYVVSYLYQEINCEVCCDALVTADPKNKQASIRFNDGFGILHPSKDVTKICEIAENNIREAIITRPKELRKKDIFKQLMVNQTLLFISTRANYIFNDYAFHQFDQGPNENHLILLMRAITEEYVNVRFRYLPKIKIGFMASFYRDLKKLSFFKTGRKNDKRRRLW